MSPCQTSASLSSPRIILQHITEDQTPLQLEHILRNHIMSCIAPRLLVVGSNWVRSNINAKTIRDTQTSGTINYNLLEAAQGPAGQAVLGLAFVAKRELGAKVTPIALRNAPRITMPVGAHAHTIFMPVPGPAPKMGPQKAVELRSQWLGKASSTSLEKSEEVRVGNKPMRLSKNEPRPTIPVVEKPSFYMGVSRPIEAKGIMRIASCFKGA